MKLSRKTWIAIGLVVLLGVLVYMSRPREGMETTQSPGILYGPAIRYDDPAGVPIKEVRTLSDGRKVYLAEDAQYVKMVAENGENGYFTGTIAQFDPAAWATYKTPGEGYKLKLTTPPVTPPPAGPSPSTPSSSANYSATCNKCTVMNNQITCACDVLPK